MDDLLEKQLAEFDPHAPVFNPGFVPSENLKARWRALIASVWKHRVETEEGLKEMRLEPISDSELEALDRQSIPLLKLAQLSK